MKKRCIFLVLLCLMLACGTALAEQPTGSVMLYSSMQENQLMAIRDAFMAKYPGIQMDYYYAGTGNVITKIATERQAGQVAADVIWVGDPSDYISFKKQGILAQYASPEAEAIDAAFIDPERYYTGARIVVVGISYNTNLVTEEEAPKNWDDLKDPKWFNQIILTDPGASGTSKYAFGGMIANPAYGIDYFAALKANGAELESGTTATHNKIAAGAYKVGICLDYVTNNLASEGATIAFTYPEKDIVFISSPIGLVSNSANQDNGKLLYDFILSAECQRVLVENNLTSVRKDATQAGLSVTQIAALSMKVDDLYLSEKANDILNAFDEVFK